MDLSSPTRSPDTLGNAPRSLPCQVQAYSNTDLHWSCRKSPNTGKWRTIVSISVSKLGCYKSFAQSTKSLVKLLLANNQPKNLKEKTSGALKLPFRSPAACVQQYRFSHTNSVHFAVIIRLLPTAYYLIFQNKSILPLKTTTIFCAGFQDPLLEYGQAS